MTNQKGFTPVRVVFGNIMWRDDKENMTCGNEYAADARVKSQWKAISPH